MNTSSISMYVYAWRCLFIYSVYMYVCMYIKYSHNNMLYMLIVI